VSKTHTESGFSLIELLVSMGVLMAVSSIVTGALLQMTQSQATIWNRTEMHSGIRGATELLQQEVGQAGRITFPGVVTLTDAINPVGGAFPAASATCDPGDPTGAGAVTVAVTTTAPGDATSGMWAVGPPGAPTSSYIMLTTLDGNNQETFRLGAVAGAASITACFSKDHLAGTVLMPMGGFATGIIPNLGIVNASNDNVLKLYGDINGDGRMVYVEYTCDIPVSGPGILYRQVVEIADGAVKLPLTADHILLTNVMRNPVNPATPLVPAPPCFTYQPGFMMVQGTPFTFILDVAITLTVQTTLIDPITKQFQTETKALLNVSPRNVFAAWSLAGIGYTDRIQSTPVTVTSLLVELP
jgi:type II secretory pathway pseudopilin PulG